MLLVLAATGPALGKAHAWDAGDDDAPEVRDSLAAADPLPAEHTVTGLPPDAQSAADEQLGVSPADTAAEPSIAVDPTDWKHAVVVFRAGIGHSIAFSSTFDAGHTWTPSAPLPRTARSLTDLNTYTGTTDPVVAFGPDGTAYATFIAFTHVVEGYGLDIKVVRLDKGAANWSGPFTVIGEPGATPETSYPDKEWLTVDRGTGPGHHPGRLYVVWSQEPLAPMATYSDDRGVSWQSVPSPVLAPELIGSGETGLPPTHGSDFQLLVLPDGSLGVFYDTGDYSDKAGDAVPEEYRFVRAAAPAPGERLTFGTPVRVAPAHHTNDAGLLGFMDPASAAIDPRSGRIYAAWPDSTRTGLNDIVLTVSSDGGASWSTPRRVNTDDGEHFHPMVAVQPSGRLVVGWRLRIGAADALSNAVDTFAVYSWNGQTFGPQARVNANHTDLALAQPNLGAVFLGDYGQLATGGRVTYLARAEAYCPPELAECSEPHQRIWVAVLR
jgi:hypothetical protein